MEFKSFQALFLILTIFQISCDSQPRTPVEYIIGDQAPNGLIPYPSLFDQEPKDEGLKRFRKKDFFIESNKKIHLVVLGWEDFKKQKFATKPLKDSLQMIFNTIQTKLITYELNRSEKNNGPTYDEELSVQKRTPNGYERLRKIVLNELKQRNIQIEELKTYSIGKFLELSATIVTEKLNYGDTQEKLTKNHLEAFSIGIGDCDDYARLTRGFFFMLKELSQKNIPVFALDGELTADSFQMMAVSNQKTTPGHAWVNLLGFGEDGKWYISSVDPTFADQGNSLDAFDEEHIDFEALPYFFFNSLDSQKGIAYWFAHDPTPLSKFSPFQRHIIFKKTARSLSSLMWYDTYSSFDKSMEPYKYEKSFLIPISLKESFYHHYPFDQYSFVAEWLHLIKTNKIDEIEDQLKHEFPYPDGSYKRNYEKVKRYKVRLRLLIYSKNEELKELGTRYYSKLSKTESLLQPEL
ncbi:MAG: hypothetical protein CL678_03135 [Bdellovibrionaceae bacterium]|nr:hypothetical protein [Pseudobdellovibrionaceae bacterium]|tara:strand:- start:8389 stop:9780 length:1392 start_codon:yes stop_codon:yes gene_type:complete